MIPAQQELLNSLIGYDGIYFEAIRDYCGVDWGTKILYLERSITQPCHDFLKSLDRLYQPELLHEAKKTNLELIRVLKAINDMCFNNQVKFGEYGIKLALTHYFSSLGDIDQAEFKTKIQLMVGDGIAKLQAAHPEERLQRQARIAAEGRQTGWRSECDLPPAQMEPASETPAMPPVENGFNGRLFGEARGRSRAPNPPLPRMDSDEERPEFIPLHVENRSSLDGEHRETYLYLVQTRAMTEAQALQEIDDLSPAQVIAIRKGATKGEIKDLMRTTGPRRVERGLDRVNVLNRFRDDGMTLAQFQGKRIEDGYYLMEAVTYLILYRHMSPAEALQEIDGISQLCLKHIANGVTKEDILACTSTHPMLWEEVITYMKVELLINFRSAGLTPALLKNLNIPCGAGDSNRYQTAFTRLINRRNMTPVDAIQELDGLTAEQLKRVYLHHETRAQVLDVRRTSTLGY